MKNVLICIDRDGTIIYDKKKRPRYYIGSQPDWKSKIKFLKDVVKGIKLLNKQLPNAPIYVITNQPGIAIKNLKLLTFKRATEVCNEVVRRLKKKGAMTKGCLICPHAIPKYIKTHPEYKFDKKLIHKNCPCFKPHAGLTKVALKSEGFKASNTNIYIIGDRASDVKTALKIKGTGILVPFEEERIEEVKKLKSKKTYIAKGFLDAAKYIIKREK